MTRITLHPSIEAAPAAARPTLESIKKKMGGVPNVFRLMANSPAVLEAYAAFNGALGTGKLDKKIRERIALAIAQKNGCSYCLAAHTYTGTHVTKLSIDEIAAARRGESSDPKADAAVKFALTVAENRGSVSEDELHAMYVSVPLQGNPTPGTSTGTAIKKMEELAAKILPPGVTFEWTELAYQETHKGSSGSYIFALSVIFVFLALAAQYESWVLPLAIILIVPLAVLAALVGVFLRGMLLTFRSTSPALFPSSTRRSAAIFASATSGTSRSSQLRQVAAFVTIAIRGWFISWAMETVPAPIAVSLFIRTMSACAF